MCKVKLTFVLVVTVFLGMACASLDKAVVSDASQREGLQELQLTPGYDIYQLRVDLIRQTTTDYVSDDSYQTDCVPYHYLGVNLGNGLFYDGNNNLTLNLDQLPELQHLENFTVIKETRGLWSQPEVYTKQGQSFQRESQGLIKARRKATLGDSVITIDEGFLSATKTITVNEDNITLRGGLFSSTLQTQPDFILLKEFLRNERYYQEQNRIYLDRNYVVQDRGNIIEITQGRGLFRQLFYFTKIANSYYFYNQRYRGVKITIRGNEVLVEDNGRDLAIFLVENASF